MTYEMQMDPPAAVALPPWCRIVRDTGPEGKYRPMAQPVVRNAREAYEMLRARCEREEVEVAIAMAVDPHGHVLAIQEIGRGTIDETMATPREIFRLAVAHGAAGVVFAHNHPSGNHLPSNADIASAKNAAEAGKVLGIPLLDSLVIGDGQYTSLRSEGYL